jgi:hypothetical protein
MNLRKSLFTGLAAVGLMASLAAPTALAQTSGNAGTGTATVVITDTGVFDIYFCDDSVSLVQDVAPTAGTDGSASGALAICYVDTKSYRTNFDVDLSSTDFTGTGANDDIIPASDFKVTYTANVSSAQWSSGVGYPIGDIGHFVNDAYPSSQAGAAWTANNNLAGAGRTVNFAYQGEGTIAAQSNLNVALTIPSSTDPDTYQSTLTLTVIVPGTQVHPSS